MPTSPTTKGLRSLRAEKPNPDELEIRFLLAEDMIKQDSKARVATRTKGKSYLETHGKTHVTIYRAVLATVLDFKKMDYVTPSRRFAIGHADHVAAVEEEDAHVIMMVARASDVYVAYGNPNEYFYDGPIQQGRVIKRVKAAAAWEGNIPGLKAAGAAAVPPGWTKSKPANYTIYTSPSGKVRVQDTHKSGKTRYQVIVKDGASWLESHESGSLGDAFRVALGDAFRVALQDEKGGKTAAGSEFHRIVAHAWAKLGWYPLAHRDGLAAVWNEMFTTLAPENLGRLPFDATWGNGVKKQIINAHRDLDGGKVLPPKKGIRLYHSIVKGDVSTVIDQILNGGMRTQSQGLGKYSEDPNALFFVEGSPNKRYSDRGAWVVVDLPTNWEGWAQAVGGWWSEENKRLEREPLPGAVVAIYQPIPAKFIVAVNGLPVADFKKAAKKKDPPAGKVASAPPGLFRQAKALYDQFDQFLRVVGEDYGQQGEHWLGNFLTAMKLLVRGKERVLTRWRSQGATAESIMYHPRVPQQVTRQILGQWGGLELFDRTLQNLKTALSPVKTAKGVPHRAAAGPHVAGLFDDAFGEPDAGATDPETDLRWRLEKQLGESASLHEAAPMFSGNVRGFIGDRLHYFTRSRAWFIYIDAPASQAVAKAKRAQKLLRGARSVKADQIILRGRTLYVGSNDGKLTKVNPIFKTALSPGKTALINMTDTKLADLVIAEMSRLAAPQPPSVDEARAKADAHEAQAATYERRARMNPGGPDQRAMLSHSAAATEWRRIHSPTTHEPNKRTWRKALKLSESAVAADEVARKNRAAIEKLKAKFNKRGSDQISQPGAVDAAKTVLSNLLAMLRAVSWNHLTSHWQVGGDASYGDHLLFERMYEKTVAEIDVFAEKLVGTFGSAIVDATKQADIMAFTLGQWDIGCPFERSLLAERTLQVNLKSCLDSMERINQLSLGMDDFLRTMANDHETHLYLLQQRQGGIRMANVQASAKTRARRQRQAFFGRCMIKKLAADASPS